MRQLFDLLRLDSIIVSDQIESLDLVNQKKRKHSKKLTRNQFYNTPAIKTRT